MGARLVTNLTRGRRFAAAIACAGVSLAACGTEHGAEPERVGVAGQDLSSANIIGTSLPAKTLALTFDDGPGDRAAELSSYLKSQGIRAAFFVNGWRIAATTLPSPSGNTPTANVAAILAQIVADGHLVANHTVTHRDMVTDVLPNGGATQLLQELSETDSDISAYVPSGRWLFRPPYGSWSNTVYNNLSGTSMNKYVGPVYWDMGGVSTNYPSQAADWACWQGGLYAGPAGTTKINLNGPGNQGYATTTQCGDAYLAEIHSVGRGIVLMHDPWLWAQGNTVDMVKYLVPLLLADGYSFVRVDEVPAITAQLPALTCHASCATCVGPGTSDCTSCATSYYKTGLTCTACSTCGAGTYRTAACTSTADTVCGACSTCAAGSYASTACTSTSDASCSSCAAGSFSGAGATSCTPCAAGSFASGSGSTSCTPCAAGSSASGPGATSCTPCTAGHYAPASATTCTACSAGNFAAGPSAFACTACPPGTYAGAGAAACTSCGNCDDGNACTVDTCDGTKGCVHTLTAGCSPPPPPPETDASTPSETPPSPAPVTPDADAGDPGTDPVAVTGQSGCSASPRSARDGSATLLLLGLALALSRRRAAQKLTGRA